MLEIKKGKYRVKITKQQNSYRAMALYDGNNSDPDFFDGQVCPDFKPRCFTTTKAAIKAANKYLATR